MKKIICPYDWDCGKEFKTAELNDYDSEFLESATDKKMTLMFIHCPKCTRMFSFDTVEWNGEPSHAKNPNEKDIIKKKKSIRELTKILEKKKVTIPNSYFEYLISENFKSSLTIFEDQDDFQLYDLNELCNVISIDGQKMLQINELKGFSNTILEVNQEYFNTKEKKEYEELANCLSIGYENTSILYLNSKDNNTLHIFHPDGGDSEKIKRITLKDVVKASR